MKTLASIVVIAMSALVLSLPSPAVAGQDAAQQAMTEKVQKAKRELAAAQAASGAERQKMMQEHMKMMSDIMTQMQKAKPDASMTQAQMREWIDEHLKLMNDLMGQMMDEHHMMMQGAGMPGGKK